MALYSGWIISGSQDDCNSASVLLRPRCHLARRALELVRQYLVVASVVALWPSVGNGQNAALDTGIHEYETYDGVRESVNLGTGNAVVTIPLLTLPGRNGLNYSVWLVSNSQARVFYGPTTIGTGMNLTRTGNIAFSTGGPVQYASDIQCMGNYAMTDENGGVHTFSSIRTGCYSISSCQNNGGCTAVPSDDSLGGPDDRGEGIVADLNSSASAPNDSAPCRLTLKTGIWFPLNCASVQTAHGVAFLSSPITMEDSNGNQITLGLSTGDTDTLGRSVSFASTNLKETIQYSDSNGMPRQIVLNYQSQSSSCTYTLDGQAQTLSGSSSQLSSVSLPNNLTYIFQYDGCGNLTKIVYPSGGYTRYFFDYSNYTHILTGPGTPVQTGTDIELTKKFVCRAAPPGQLGATSIGTGNTCSVAEDTTTYAPVVNSSICNNSSNVVTDPLGNQTSYSFINYQSCAYSVLESSRVTYQGTSTVLRTVNTAYTSGNSLAYYPSDQTTILPNNYQSKVHWDYSGPANEGWIGDKLEYDWGNGAYGFLLRKTITPFQCNWKPASVTVEDRFGTQIALTTYAFDKYTSITPSGATQHDSAYGTSFTNRCNVTSIGKWRSTDGATLTTTRQFDDSGNVLLSTDPKGIPTTTSYGDSWGNSSCAPASGNAAAFATSVTVGNPSGLHLTTTSKYNSCTGSVSSTTDPNGQITSYAYDRMDRLYQTKYPSPDNGVVSNCYSELSEENCYVDSFPVEVVRTQLISSAAATNKVTTAVLDGLARVSQTQLNSDPYGAVYVDTIYDGDGHIASVSTPYRSKSETTYGTVSYAYDGLGRKVEQIDSDGAGKQWWCYDNLLTSSQSNCHALAVSGKAVDWVDSADENGNDWQRTTDGLGRLINVVEPNGTATAPSMETDYSYDPLNDLLNVTQWGGAYGSSGVRSRSFAYDSLSELTSATNPESGTTAYTYDLDGNLGTKTDARGITTTYTLDALNRLTSKSYTGDTTGTPLSCYQFGTSTTNNENGRLVAYWTVPSSGTCAAAIPSSGYLSAHWILGYDVIGRVTGMQQGQCTQSGCSVSSPYTLNMQYDQAGDMTQLQNSVGAQNAALTLNYYVDSAERPCLATSSWNAGFSPNIFQTNPSTSSPGYFAFGGLENWSVGSSSSSTSSGCSSSPSSTMNLQQAFDSRLRLKNFQSGGQVP